MPLLSPLLWTYSCPRCRYSEWFAEIDSGFLLHAKTETVTLLTTFNNVCFAGCLLSRLVESSAQVGKSKKEEHKFHSKKQQWIFAYGKTRASIEHHGTAFFVGRGLATGKLLQDMIRKLPSWRDYGTHQFFLLLSSVVDVSQQALANTAARFYTLWILLMAVASLPLHICYQRSLYAQPNPNVEEHQADAVQLKRY